MNLLIVDDQPNVLSYLTTVIKWETVGIDEVFSASSVLVAKNIIQNHEIDILLTDIEMPIENGIDLIRWVREQGIIDMRIILLTSHSDFQYARSAITYRVHEYVLQPAKDEDILRAVASAVETSESRKNAGKADPFPAMDLKERNKLVQMTFQNWPNEPTSESNETDVFRIQQLRALGFHWVPENHYVFFETATEEWNRLPPAEPADCLPIFEEASKDIFAYINGNTLTYFTENFAALTLLSLPNTDDIETYLQLFLTEVQKQLSCTAKIRYTRIHFTDVKNAHSWFMAHPQSLEDGAIAQISFSQRGSDNAALQHYYDQIYQYIREHISMPITRTEIASEIHVSDDYVSRIVRTIAGCTCNELIRHMKMDHARNLVRTTQLPIGNIAVECGFDSFAYFSRIYRDVYGVTPTQDRFNT